MNEQDLKDALTEFFLKDSIVFFFFKKFFSLSIY